METLSAKMKVRLRTDDCNDRCVIGKRGDVHRGTRGGVSGYYISIMYLSARKFHIELKKCLDIGAEITQEGDTEGVVFIPRSVALENARLLRSVIHARRLMNISPELRAARVESLRRARESLKARALQGAKTDLTDEDEDEAA